MKKLFQGKFFLIAIIVFVLIITSTVLLVLNLGKAYQGGLSRFLNQKPPAELILNSTKNIRKITIKKVDSNECMEVTPDGIVRVYKNCNGDLSSADRLIDPKNILKLFKLVSEKDLTKLKNFGRGQVYELTVETDQGTQIVHLVLNAETADTVGEIINTIHNITSDIPHPSPSDVLNVSLPSGSGDPSSVISPPLGSNPYPSPSSGGENSYQPTFVCEFTQSGDKKKPVNVSNIVCSTNPSPEP